jgi:hypothetical protein
MCAKDHTHPRLAAPGLRLDPGARCAAPAISDLGSAHLDQLVGVAGVVTRAGPVRILEARRLYECTRCKHRQAPGGRGDGVCVCVRARARVCVAGVAPCTTASCCDPSHASLRERRKTGVPDARFGCWRELLGSVRAPPPQRASCVCCLPAPPPPHPPPSPLQVCGVCRSGAGRRGAAAGRVPLRTRQALQRHVLQVRAEQPQRRSAPCQPQRAAGGGRGPGLPPGGPLRGLGRPPATAHRACRHPFPAPPAPCVQAL